MDESWIDTILAALDACTEQQRTVYLLVEGLNPDGTNRPPLRFYEVAQILDISSQATRFRYMAAEVKVTRALARRLVEQNEKLRAQLNEPNSNSSCRSCRAEEQ